MTKNELIALRDLLPDDYNFILATWLRGLYYGDSIFTLMKKDTFMRQYHVVLEKVMQYVTVKVACLKEDPSIILGYVVLSPDQTTLHWVFTKKSWRNIGIAKSLVPTSIKKVTHLTKLGIDLVNKKGNIEFDPFSL